MQNAVIPVDKLQDPIALNMHPDRGRDACRTPLQWSAAPYGGFSEVESWLPLAEDYQSINVAMQDKSARSILSLYRQLLHYRKKYNALNCGSYKPINNTPQDCFVYLREKESERYLIILNFGDSQQNLALDSIAQSGNIILSTQLERSGLVELFSLSLRPHEGLLIRL